MRVGASATALLALATMLAAAASTLGPATARVPGAVLPEPTWRPCPDDPSLHCGELVVPLDHAVPDGASVRLATRRLPAGDPSARIGLLVTIAGGPGQRGSDFVDARRYPPPIREAFDIVSWDPRGTSGETIIDCIPEWDPYGSLDRTPDTEAERTALATRTEALAADCRTQHGAILPFIGTHEAALDLERLRQQLGAETITLHGTSYGSKVALVYASLFPERVRAVLIDGYADPNQTPAERDLEQATAFERELDRLLACPDQAACPPGVESAATLDALLRDLDAAPISAAGDRALREADVFEAMAASLLRDRDARSRLLRAIGTAAGGDGSALLAMADGSREAFVSSGLSLGVFAAITCADDAAFWRSLGPDGIAAHGERVRAASPRFGPWLSPERAADPAGSLGLCAMQPDAAGLPTHGFDAAGAGPILVVATTGDPTTPLSAARRALSDLADASLLVVEAEGHSAFGTAMADAARPASRCVVDVVEHFLLELQQPRASKTCP